ncbi:MAG: hypothetical protein PHV18_05685 [Lachnospiraceae bacterium]|nr:hypothetical protein [Lachnospiraceae bacterium]
MATLKIFWSSVLGSIMLILSMICKTVYALLTCILKMFGGILMIVGILYLVYYVGMLMQEGLDAGYSLISTIAENFADLCVIIIAWYVIFKLTVMLFAIVRIAISNFLSFVLEGLGSACDRKYQYFIGIISKEIN